MPGSSDTALHTAPPDGFFRGLVICLPYLPVDKEKSLVAAVFAVLAVAAKISFECLQSWLQRPKCVALTGANVVAAG